MAKVSYSKLNLKVNTDVNTFTFNDTEIEVLKYLPIEDKYDIIMVALQKAYEDGIYNDIKLDMYFHLYLVYMYTNLTFTDKQKENASKIFDSLMSNGFFDVFLATMEEREYEELIDMMNIVKEDKTHYNSTVVSVLKTLLTDMPKEAEKAAEIVKTINPDDYEKVINLAKAAGFRD